jgi:hypothetical protein
VVAVSPARRSGKNTLKYLLVLALIALLFWLAYRRLRPYIQTLRQMLGILRGTLGKPPAVQSEFGRSARTENKLVRCSACNTWIPPARALHSNATSYCSKACLQKAPAVKRRVSCL